MNVPNSSTINLIYLKYHGVGFSPSLVLTFMPTYILAIIAILLNSSLIYLAIKFRSSLHGPFNSLIAFESFGATLFEFGALIRFPIPLSGINYIRADPICFILNIPGFIGMKIQFVSMLGIGIERLICVLFPIWFSKNSLKYFVYFVIFIGIIFGIFACFLLFEDIFFGELKGKEIMCALGDGVGSNYKTYMPLNKHFQIPTVFIYICIWLIMLKAIIQKRNVLSKYNLHILKSISAIMLIIIFGWTLQDFGPYYTSYIVLSPEAMFIYAARMIDSYIIAGAMNTPILFIFSKQHRKYFIKIFPFLRWICKVNPATPNVQIVQQNNNPLATVSKEP